MAVREYVLRRPHRTPGTPITTTLPGRVVSAPAGWTPGTLHPEYWSYVLTSSDPPEWIFEVEETEHG